MKMIPESGGVCWSSGRYSRCDKEDTKSCFSAGKVSDAKIAHGHANWAVLGGSQGNRKRKDAAGRGSGGIFGNLRSQSEAVTLGS